MPINILNFKILVFIILLIYRLFIMNQPSTSSFSNQISESNPEPMPVKKFFNLSPLLSVIFLLLIIASVLVGFFLGKSSSQKKVSSFPSPSPTYPTFPTLIPSPSKAPAREIDPTANWKTYTNSEYKFTFKYPQGLSFQILDEKVTDKPKVFLRLYQQENQSYPIIDLILTKTDLTPEQWIKENDYCPSSFNSCTTPVESPIPKSIQFEETNRHYAGLTTLFKNKEILFEFGIEATEPNNPIETSVRNTYNLILSTFKFLD